MIYINPKKKAYVAESNLKGSDLDLFVCKAIDTATKFIVNKIKIQKYTKNLKR